MQGGFTQDHTFAIFAGRVVLRASVAAGRGRAAGGGVGAAVQAIPTVLAAGRIGHRREATIVGAVCGMHTP